MEQIDERIYHKFTIDKCYSKGDRILTRGNEMMIIRYDLFEIQYKQMRKLSVPLCKTSPDRYYCNILGIITLVYHMYIEYEIYNLVYIRNPGFLYESKFTEVTMGKWDDH